MDTFAFHATGSLQLKGEKTVLLDVSVVVSAGNTTWVIQVLRGLAGLVQHQLWTSHLRAELFFYSSLSFLLLETGSSKTWSC